MLKLFVYDAQGNLVEVTPTLLAQVGMSLEEFQEAFECVTRLVPVQRSVAAQAPVPYARGYSRPLDMRAVGIYTVAFALLLLALGALFDLPGPLGYVSDVSEWVVASIFSDDALTVTTITPSVLGGDDDQAGGGAPSLPAQAGQIVTGANPPVVLGGDPVSDPQAGGGVPPVIVTDGQGTTREVVDGRATITDLVPPVPTSVPQTDMKPQPTNCREDPVAMMTVCDPPAAAANASTAPPPAPAPATTYQGSTGTTTYVAPNYTPANPVTTGVQPSQETQFNQTLQEGLSAFNSGSCPAFSSCP